MELDTIEPQSKKRKLVKKKTKEPSKLIVFELPSGKTVLCASTQLITHSRVFERMLSHSYIDSSKTCIKISDINENAFIKLIHYFCGCELKLDDSLSCRGVCLYNLIYRNASDECPDMIQKESYITSTQSSTSSIDSSLSFSANSATPTTLNLEELQCNDISEETVDIHNISMQLAPTSMCVMDLLSCSERFFVENLLSRSVKTFS